MCKNSTTPDFDQFLEVMDIDPKDKNANSNKTWETLQLKYFVATQMNSDEHRRHIGNSPAFIFFKEAGEQFDASEIDKLGMVPQLFFVVQKNKQGYKIGYFRSGNVQSHLPPIPKNYVFEDFAILRKFILTKIHNGYISFFNSPSLSQNFYATRADTLASLDKHKKTK